MTQPVTLIDRLQTMRALMRCPNCNFPRSDFDLGTIADAIAAIEAIELVLTKEEGTETKIV
jgi:hypothetical protein